MLICRLTSKVRVFYYIQRLMTHSGSTEKAFLFLAEVIMERVVRGLLGASGGGINYVRLIFLRGLCDSGSMTT